MADETNIALLKQGVNVWNRWRQAHSKVAPNFVGVNLSHVDLSHADLQAADLQRL